MDGEEHGDRSSPTPGNDSSPARERKSYSDLQGEKLELEIRALRKKFYEHPSFWAGLVGPVFLAMAGLVFSYTTGWFDVKRERLELNKDRLEIQTDSLEAKSLELSLSFERRRDSLNKSYQVRLDSLARLFLDSISTLSSQAELISVATAHQAQNLRDTLKALAVAKEILIATITAKEEQQKRSEFKSLVSGLLEIFASSRYGRKLGEGKEDLVVSTSKKLSSLIRTGASESGQYLDEINRICGTLSANKDTVNGVALRHEDLQFVGALFAQIAYAATDCVSWKSRMYSTVDSFWLRFHQSTDYASPAWPDVLPIPGYYDFWTDRQYIGFCEDALTAVLNLRGIEIDSSILEDAATNLGIYLLDQLCEIDTVFGNFKNSAVFLDAVILYRDRFLREVQYGNCLDGQVLAGLSPQATIAVYPTAFRRYKRGWLKESRREALFESYRSPFRCPRMHRVALALNFPLSDKLNEIRLWEQDNVQLCNLWLSSDLDELRTDTLLLRMAIGRE